LMVMLAATHEQNAPNSSLLTPSRTEAQKYISLFHLYQSDKLSSLAILVKLIHEGILMANSQKNPDTHQCIVKFFQPIRKSLFRTYEIMHFLGDRQAKEKLLHIRRDVKVLLDLTNEKSSHFKLEQLETNTSPHKELRRWWWNNQMNMNTKPNTSSSSQVQSSSQSQTTRYLQISPQRQKWFPHSANQQAARQAALEEAYNQDYPLLVEDNS
jgi:hypothetical protein